MDTSSPSSSDDPVIVRAARWFQATPLELAGLTVLLTGALVASWVVWVSAAHRPSELPAAGALQVGQHDDTVAGEPVGAHGEGAEPDAPAADELPSDAPLLVHVTGAVTSPGLVVVDAGARVGDAVEAAGGLVSDAATELINLARTLVDGEHVHVPRLGEDPPLGGGAPSADGLDPAGGGVAFDGRIDLNHASVDQLQTLPGIGPAKADAIVRHRESNGRFSVPGDLRDVPGIGEVTFQRLADLVTVG